MPIQTVTVIIAVHLTILFYKAVIISYEMTTNVTTRRAGVTTRRPSVELPSLILGTRFLPCNEGAWALSLHCGTYTLLPPLLVIHNIYNSTYSTNNLLDYAEPILAEFTTILWLLLQSTRRHISLEVADEIRRCFISMFLLF